MDEDINKPKNPEVSAEPVPTDILRKARFTRVEGPDNEPPRIHFYERVPEKGGKSLFSVAYTSENNSKYFPAPQEVPPYSPDELDAVRKDLHAQLDAIRDKIDPTLALEVDSRIDSFSTPKTLNVVEDDLFMMEERFGGDKVPATPDAPTSAPAPSPEPVVGAAPGAPAAAGPTVAPKVMSKGGPRPGPSVAEAGSPPPSPPEPPLEKRPLSDRRSNVENPFVFPRQGLGVQLEGSDSYLPEFIRERLPQQPPPHPGLREEPPTMDVILADPKKQELFGMLVESMIGDRGTTVIKKLMSPGKDPANIPTESEFALLQQCRVEFQRRTLFLEEVRAATTNEDVAYMLQNDPTFSFLRQSLKPERAAELIKQHMEKTFFRLQSDNMLRIVFAQRATRDMRRSEYFEQMRRQAQERLRSHNFTMRDVRKFFRGNWKKMLDINPAEMIERAFGINGITPERSAAVLKAIDLNRENIMQILGAAISSDTELKLQVIREMRTGVRSVPDIGENGPHTIGEAWQEQLEGELQIGNTDALRRRIRNPGFRAMVTERFGKPWDEMVKTQEGQEALEKASYEELQAEGLLPQRKRGWFGMWLGGIFDTLFPDMQKKLANEFEPEKK